MTKLYIVFCPMQWLRDMAYVCTAPHVAGQSFPAYLAAFEADRSGVRPEVRATQYAQAVIAQFPERYELAA